MLESVLSSFDIAPTKGASDVATPKRGGLDALVAFYPKVVLVTLPSAASPETLLRPVAWLVGRMLVLPD